jgi:LPXTG-motif cell wall-anchored protein
MDMSNLVLLGVLGVLFVLYVGRRRNRLSHEE